MGSVYYHKKECRIENDIRKNLKNNRIISLDFAENFIKLIEKKNTLNHGPSIYSKVIVLMC